jgi:addiction module HigA family antidote
MTMTMMHNPASPGELLREFLGDTTATELAGHIGVARATISRILNGRTAVTMDLSIRLGEALALSPASVRPMDRIAEEEAEDQAVGGLTTCGGVNCLRRVEPTYRLPTRLR